MERGGGIAAPGGNAERTVTVEVPSSADGARLDRTLADLLPDTSRSQIKRLIESGHVALADGNAAKPSTPVSAGQAISVTFPAEAPSDRPRPQELELAVLHEDDDLVVVDKPAGLVVHAGAGEHDATLVNALLHRYGDSLSRLGGELRPGIVHRLDKGTSGVIVVARNDAAHESLAGQFAARTVGKEYVAVVYGCPREAGGAIDLALGRDRSDRTKASPHTDRPRDARSRWEVAEPLAGFARLRVFPETGRTHQVRAHLAALHHPCVGDDKYAGARWKGVAARGARDVARRFPRPALHARRLTLQHPTSGERMTFSAPLPADLTDLLAALRRV